MKLTRSGASRNHGKTQVVNKDVKTPQFDAKTMRIRLQARDQRDPINRSTYDYELELSLEEVGSIIDALDRIPAIERTALIATLGSRTRSLLRLAHVAAGVPVQDNTAA